MRPNWYRTWRVLAFCVDAVFISAALCALTAWRFGLDAVPLGFVPAPGREFGRAPLLFAIPLWLGVFGAFGLYSPHRLQNTLEEARRLITAGPAAAVGVVMLGFVVKENPARSWLFGAVVVGLLAAAVGRQTMRGIVARLRDRGRWLTPTVVVGRQQAKEVVETLLQDSSRGLKPVATCGLSWPGLPDWSIEHCAEAVQATAAGEVVVVGEGLERREIAAALEAADRLPVHVVVLPGLDYLLLGSLQLVSVGHEPGLALESPALRRYQQPVKRALDLVVSSLGLLVSLPLLGSVAICVRLIDGKPILFRQKREGKDGYTFNTYKFRTMRSGAESDHREHGSELGLLTKDADDARVTRLGRFLRKSSLDELPQLWNVVKGDMSLVGPRPLRMWEAEQLAMHRRLVVRPGITGLWQVSGRSQLSPQERVRLDLVYVQNWSLLLDLSILLRTVPAVVSRRGAY